MLSVCSCPPVKELIELTHVSRVNLFDRVDELVLGDRILHFDRSAEQRVPLEELADDESSEEDKTLDSIVSLGLGDLRVSKSTRKDVKVPAETILSALGVQSHGSPDEGCYRRRLWTPVSIRRNMSAWRRASPRALCGPSGATPGWNSGGNLLDLVSFQRTPDSPM